MIEHIVVAIALVVLGVLALYLQQRPRAVVERLIRVFLPGYKLIKARKKAKMRVRKGSEKKKEEVFL